MIYTLTLNPVLDITVSTATLNRDEINRSSLKSVSAGGKGLNTSRALNCLGVRNTAIALCGGVFYNNIREFLSKEQINAHLINISGSTRVGIKIVEEQSQKLIELNEAGPAIKKGEVDTLLRYLKNMDPKPKYFVISGSLPQKIAPEIYCCIINLLKLEGIKTLLDASGEALYHGMLALPEILKINMREICHVSEKYFKQEPQYVINEFLKKGIKMILITNGPEPVSFYNAGGKYSVISPDIKGPFKTGAGDSVNAGLIYSLLNDFEIEDLLKFSVACGNANILSEVPGMLDMDKVKEITGLVRVTRDQV